MIGLILALDYEIESSILKKFQYEELNGQKFYFNDELVITFSGVGKTNAAISVCNLINNFLVDEIFNIGSCGTTNNNINILDVILIDKCQYCDVDVSVDPKYEINQIPYEPKLFQSNPKTNNLLIKVLNELNINYKFGNFATIDSFVTKDNVNKFNEITNSNILGVDMEISSIAQTCWHYKLPFSSIKIVSDSINSVNSHNDFENNMISISKISKNIVSKFIEKLI